MRIAAATIIGLAAMLVAGCGAGVRSTPTPLPVVTVPGINPPNSSPPLTTRDELNQRAKWTILVYLDADNDLESAGIVNFNQMEMIGSTQDVHVLVQIDRIPGHDSSNGDWTDTRRYLVTRDSNSSLITSIRLDDPSTLRQAQGSGLGELDMGDWRTLKNFVEWGIKESPSDNYCLVIWDHGTGWQFRAEAVPQRKYIALDDTSYSAINVTDLPKALAGSGLAVVAFDACLMQQIEVAYELKGCASYMVASAASEPSPGYNYYAWISRATANTTPREMCGIICEEYAAAYPPPHKGITQSAIELAKIGDVASTASEFALLLRGSTAYWTALGAARGSTLNYSTADGGPNRNYFDLVDYASLCATAIGPPAQAADTRLASAVSSAVVAEVHNPDTPDARGLGIYVPPPGSYNTAYSSLQFAADTSWDEWLRSMGY